MFQAFAKMDYDPGQQLLQDIADELATKASDCNPQNVANSVWAFGSLGEGSCKLQLCIPVKCSSTCPEIVWAIKHAVSMMTSGSALLAVDRVTYMHAGFHPGDGVLQKLAEAAEEKLDDFVP